MHLSDFINRSKKLFPDCIVGEPCESDKIVAIERQLGVSFPNPIKDFYAECNGIEFKEPPLRVLPLSDLRFDSPGQFLTFCIVGKEERIAFDTSNINAADQWSIYGMTENYLVTCTMASFWSSKIWGWLEHARPIWSNNEYSTSEQDTPQTRALGPRQNI